MNKCYKLYRMTNNMCNGLYTYSKGINTYHTFYLYTHDTERVLVALNL